MVLSFILRLVTKEGGEISDQIFLETLEDHRKM